MVKEGWTSNGQSNSVWSGYLCAMCVCPRARFIGCVMRNGHHHFLWSWTAFYTFAVDHTIGYIRDSVIRLSAVRFHPAQNVLLWIQHFWFPYWVFKCPICTLWIMATFRSFISNEITLFGDQQYIFFSRFYGMLNDIVRVNGWNIQFQAGTWYVYQPWRTGGGQLKFYKYFREIFSNYILWILMLEAHSHPHPSHAIRVENIGRVICRLLRTITTTKLINNEHSYRMYIDLNCMELCVRSRKNEVVR